MSAGPRVLVVEDDDAIRTLLVAALRREPFEVDAANDGDQALRMTQSREYAVIVLDLMMPRINGFDFLEAFRKATPDARSVIFIVTAFDDSMVGKFAPGQVHAIIRKPFDVPQLVTMVREVAMASPVRESEQASVETAIPLSDVILPADEPAN